MIKKVLLFTYALITSALLCACSGINQNTKFEAFIDDYFKKEVTSNTINLHYTLMNPDNYGISDYEVCLPDFSKEARASQRSDIEKEISLLHKFHKSLLSDSNELEYDILDDYLASSLKLSDYPLYQEVLSPSGGVHSELPVLLAEYRLDNSSDIEEYLCLLTQFDRYFDQILDFEKAKADAGLFMNDTACIDVIKQCEDFIEKPEENYLIASFDNRILDLNDLSDQKKSAFIDENKRIVCEQVIPAYTKLIHGLTDLIGRGKNDGGLCNFSDGTDYYEALVYATTGCSDSVSDINKRINKNREDNMQMLKTIMQKKPSLASDCECYDWSFSNEDEMLEGLKAAIVKDFPAACDTSCELCFVDPCLSDCLAPAFYITAPLDSYDKNTIFVNDAKDYSKVKYFTTLAHEGYPGHLYQTVMSYNYGLKPFRTLLDFGGFTEGWATYVEMQAYHYCGLDEDLASFLELNQIITLSLYASSDIGIHYLGWDFSDMVDFWSEYGISDENTINDIMNYIISEPGNYLKYFVGYLEFEKLKATDLDSMAFHEAILKIGPAPFDIIEKRLAALAK